MSYSFVQVEAGDGACLTRNFWNPARQEIRDPNLDWVANVIELRVIVNDDGLLVSTGSDDPLDCASPFPTESVEELLGGHVIPDRVDAWIGVGFACARNNDRHLVLEAWT